MAQVPFDNSQLRELESFDKLIYRARIQDFSPYVLLISKFGLNTDLDSGVKEDIWSAGGTKTDTTSADVLEVLSSNAADTAAGTGARTVLIYGYDSNYDFITEAVTLNGTSAVETTQSFIDIYRCIVTSSGSGVYNAGNITIRQKTGPITVGQIPAGYNITQMSHFIIPNGYTGFLQGVSGGISGDQSGAGTKVGILSLEQKPFGGTWIRGFTAGFTSESGPVQFQQPLKSAYTQKTRIKATGITESNNTSVEAFFSFILISNDYL